MAEKMRADSGQAAGRRAETLLSKQKGAGSERRKEKGSGNMRRGQ